MLDHFHFRFWFAVLLVSSSCLMMWGQTPETAIVSGHIIDQTGAAIPRVTVILKNVRTGLQRSVASDNIGDFSAAGLPTGAYEISASKAGFAEAKVEVTTAAGGEAHLRIQLSAAAAQTVITVTGVAGTVQTAGAEVGVRVDATQAEEMPLLNRRITYLPLLNSANRPAINQGDVFMNQNLFTANGTGRRQTWFEVDGSNASDLWGRQTIFTNLQLANIQELDVISNSLSAEYGATAGSVVNIVTRSGGRQYHGEAEGVWRPADTSASLAGFLPQTANGNFITSDSLGQSSLAFSGPIGTDERTHFFLSSEYSWENRGSPVTSVLAPGTFVGHYRDWLGLVRVDRQLSRRHTLFVRANLDQFHDTNPNGAVGGNNLPTVDRIFKRWTYTTELGEVAALTPDLLNDLHLQFQLASPITEFDPVLYGTQFVVPIAGAATFTTGTSQSALLQNRQYEMNDTLSVIHERHTLKLGGDLIRAHNGGNSKEFGGPIYLGQLTYNTCSQPISACESPGYLNDINNVQKYTQSYGNARYTVDDTLGAAFVQDDYRVRPDLVLSAGLRYERQSFTDSTKDFAPRVGFAYNLRGDQKTVLRGGFGLYYSQVVDNLAASYALTGPTGVFNYTATPGQVGFPASVADVPLPAFPPGAVAPLRSLYIRPGEAAYYGQFFPTSALIGYQSGLWNPYTEQWTLGIERTLAQNWVLSVDYVGSHSLKINRPLDVDPPAPFVRTAQGQTRSAQAANCTRPYWISWYQQNGETCDPAQASNPQPPYALIQSDVNDGIGTYHALDVNLNHNFTNRLSLLASYTWSHAIDNVDPDIPGQNPNDPNFTGRQEIGNAIFDQRHRFVVSGFYRAPFEITVGGIGTLGSGLPYNIVTGTTNGGDTGGSTDRPVIGGAVIPRNAGRGRAVYDISPFVERVFGLGGERAQLKLRAEAFNVFNHANFVGYSGTYGNGAAAPAGLGQPLTGITNQLPARSLQFSARVSF